MRDTVCRRWPRCARWPTARAHRGRRPLAAAQVLGDAVHQVGPRRIPAAGARAGPSPAPPRPSRRRPARLGACSRGNAPATEGGPVTNDEVVAAVEERDVKFIRLWFTDILGPAQELRDHQGGAATSALEQGMGFDGSSITGFNAIEESDMIAMPDPSTFAILPYRPAGAGGGAHVLRRPRAGRRALRGRPALRAAPGARPGAGDGLRPLLPRARSSSTSTSRTLRGHRGARPAAATSTSPRSTPRSDLRRDTVLALEEMGIAIEYSHHEVGPSQHEIDMRFADALQHGRQRHDLPARS